MWLGPFSYIYLVFHCLFTHIHGSDEEYWPLIISRENHPNGYFWFFNFARGYVAMWTRPLFIIYYISICLSAIGQSSRNQTPLWLLSVQHNAFVCFIPIKKKHAKRSFILLAKGQKLCRFSIFLGLMWAILKTDPLRKTLLVNWLNLRKRFASELIDNAIL